jgi:predicted transcriptional regulator
MVKVAGITESRLIGALRKYGGLPALAAKELGITRQAVHQRIKNSEGIRAALAEIEDENLDVGIGHLIKKVRAGDMRAIQFYLDRKGRKRGYGNSLSVAVEDAQVEAFIDSLGGNVEAYRAALRQLGVPPSEIP